ncbi:transposase [Streptomyces sp. NPDC057236]|uniref:transposase n=1 Tax=Streptomyces sp. NPDC057236 TaxID=3346059 RepID=UPI00362894B4
MSRVRQTAGRDREPTAGTIDTQSVKAATSVPAASRGFDGAKEVNGRERHIVVDALGLLLTVVVTAASATDRDTGRAMLVRLRERHWCITLVWADGGYTGRLVDLARDTLRIAPGGLERGGRVGPAAAEQAAVEEPAGLVLCGDRLFPGPGRSQGP